MQQFLTRAPCLSALFGTVAALALAGQAQAQVPPIQPTKQLGTLMFFDGVGAQGGLVTEGPNLYGASTGGGYALGGLLYQLALDTAGPTLFPIITIHQFGRLDVWQGADPGASLLLGSDGDGDGKQDLYGVTTLNAIDSVRRTTSGTGTLFRVGLGGQNFTKLYEFDPLTADGRGFAVNVSGATPQGTLIEGLESGVRYLYGSALRGGTNGTGTIFKIRADGTGFQVLANFGVIETKTVTDDDGTTRVVADLNAHNQLRNHDGVNPNQRLTLGGDGYLYGVTTYGGMQGTGVIFRVSIAGGAVEVLNEFDAIVPGSATTDPITPDTNAEGAYPMGGLTLTGGRLYGTASGLSASARGNVFSLVPTGAGPGVDFTLLRVFSGGDGGRPSGNLIIASDGNLVGTTETSGTLPNDATTGQPVVGTASGTVYKLSLAGAYSEECVFNSNDAVFKGATPTNGVVQTADGNFYGTTQVGGYGFGLIYKCGTASERGEIGLRPFVDDEGSGAMPAWMLALLATILGVQITRQVVRQKRRV